MRPLNAMIGFAGAIGSTLPVAKVRIPCGWQGKPVTAYGRWLRHASVGGRAARGSSAVRTRTPSSITAGPHAVGGEVLLVEIEIVPRGPHVAAEKAGPGRPRYHKRLSPKADRRRRQRVAHRLHRFGGRAAVFDAEAKPKQSWASRFTASGVGEPHLESGARRCCAPAAEPGGCSSKLSDPQSRPPGHIEHARSGPAHEMVRRPPPMRRSSQAQNHTSF